MHPDIRKLLEVQKVDTEIARIQRDLDSLPKEEARRSEAVAKAKAACEQARQVLSENLVRSRENEVSIKAADEEVEKLESRLNVVQNNAEYQATLLQIEAVRRERGGLEEEGLGFLEGLEGRKEVVAEWGKKLEDEESTFAGFMAEANKLKDSAEAELARVSDGRDALVDGVPKDLQDKYKTVFQSRDSLAVCAVEGGVCVGCYTNISPNDTARLIGAQSIVQCSSCDRLLYLPGQ